MQLPGVSPRANVLIKFTVHLVMRGIAEIAECVNITAMEFDKLASIRQRK